MAAGEYVSVSSQSDTEKADLDRERNELETDSEAERNELAAICVSHGLEPALAGHVADQLMAHDAFAAHARDELGISELTTARTIQAAFASVGTFAIGATTPLIIAVVTPQAVLIPVVIVTSILFLSLLGGVGTHARGTPVMKVALRVTCWGALAMELTAGVGALFGAAV